MSKNANIIKQFLRGRLRCAEFALTNACIAKCSFCNIWKQKPKVFVDREKALLAIDRLADFGVSHITLTGGDPVLHRDIVDFVKKVSARNVNSSVLNAAPRLLMRNDILRQLKDADCDLVSISFDSGDPSIMAQSRQIPNIMEDMAEVVKTANKIKLKTMASVLIWNDNYDKIEEVCARAANMGFDFICFNYPTFSKSRVYPLGGEGINLSRENVIQGLRDAIRLKESGKYNILNLAASMKNIIDYLEDPEKVRFFCKGGVNVMFVDWFFDVHPCMQLPDVIGNILTMKESDFVLAGDSPKGCNKCNMSWYRDFSIYFHGIKSIPATIESFAGSAKILKK